MGKEPRHNVWVSFSGEYAGLFRGYLWVFHRTSVLSTVAVPTTRSLKKLNKSPEESYLEACSSATTPGPVRVLFLLIRITHTYHLP